MTPSSSASPPPSMFENSNNTASSSSSPEFVAVILAATVGARLFPLTTSLQTSPKHLLPICGVPCILRLLHNLSESAECGGGFAECVLVLSQDDQVTLPVLLGNNSSSSSEDEDNDDDVPRFEQVATKPHVVLRSKNTVTSLKVTIVRVVEEDDDHASGSISALCAVEEAQVVPVSSHIVVMPGDLVVLDAKSAIADLVHAHRCSNSRSSADNTSLAAACTMLLSDVGEVDENTGIPLKESAKQKKGSLAREPEEIEYMALSSYATVAAASSSSPPSRVIWKQSKFDVEHDKHMSGATPKCVIPKARLGSGMTRIGTDWNDVHVYVLSPWVRQLVAVRAAAAALSKCSTKKSSSSSSFLSIQQDLLPLLIARQFRGILATFGSRVDEKKKLEILFESWTVQYRQQGRTDTTLMTADNSNNNNVVRLTSLSAASSGDTVSMTMKKQQQQDYEYAVLAHVVDRSAVLRAHSVASYLHANKEVAAKIIASAAASTTTTTTVVDSSSSKLLLPKNAVIKSKFGTIVLPQTETDEKVSFKSAVVGRNCKLGTKCRLNNVVIMDHVTVGDNTILQNSVLGEHCTVAENCNLNDCQVGSGKAVPAGTKEKGESFVATANVTDS